MTSTSSNSIVAVLTNRLIREGAKLVMQVEDVLQELNLSSLATAQESLPGLEAAVSDEEAALMTVLDADPQHVDDLSRRAGLSVT